MASKFDKSERGDFLVCHPFIFYLGIIDKFLARLAMFLGSALVIVSVVIVFYSVLMRYVLNVPQTWTDELVSYFLVSIAMLGVAETLRRNDHITVDLISSKLGSKHKKAVDLWGMVAVIGVGIAMFFSSFQMVAFSFNVNLISDGYVEAPMWIPQSSLLVGYGFLVLSAINRLIHICLSLSKSTGSKSVSDTFDMSN